MKRALLILLCILLPIVAAAGWLITTESGLRWAWQRAAPWLPAELSVQQVSGVLKGPLEISGIAYRSEDLTMHAASARLDWNPWALTALQLDITQLRIESLRLELPQQAADSGDTAQPPRMPALAMPVALRVGELEIGSIDIARGESRWTLERLRLGLKTDGERIDIATLELRSEIADAALRGHILAGGDYDHDLDFDWSLRLASGAMVDAHGTLAGNLGSTRLEQRLQGAVQMQQTLQVDEPLGELSWRSNIVINGYDRRLIGGELPTVEGVLRAQLEGNLESVRATGSLDTALPPVGAIAAEFELQSLDGERRFEGLRVERLKLRTLNGEIVAHGEAEWLPVPGWNAEIDATGIDPAVLASDWPGRLNARLKTRGSLDDGELQASARIESLTGSLREYPFTAGGDLAWSNGELTLAGLEIGSGDSRAKLNGRVGDELELAWSLKSRDLDQLYPGAGGSLDAEGTLHGPRAAPRVDARLVGESIAYEEHRAGRLSGTIAMDLVDFSGFDIDLEARDLRLGQLQLHSLRLDADPQRIDANLVAAEGSAKIELEGELDGDTWRGNLVDARLVTREFSTWRLAEPAALFLSRERVDAARTCLRNAQGGSVCAVAEWQQASWDADLEIAALPLRLLSPLMPKDVAVDGLAGGTVRLAMRDGKTLAGDITIALQPGSARLDRAAGEPLQLAYRGLELDMKLTEAGIEAAARLDLPNGDQLQAVVGLPGADPLDFDTSSQAVRATLRGRIGDLTLADTLLPEVDRLAGLLELDLMVTGSLGNPRSSGSARLSGASLRIERLDLPLTGLEIVARGDAATSLEYSASGSLAGGRIEASGKTRLDARSGWPSDFSLDGDNFAIADFLRSWLQDEVEVDGRFGARARLHLDTADRLRGEIELASASGALLYPLLEGEIEQLDYRDARIGFTLGEDGIGGDASATFGDGNSFEAKLDLPGARLPALDLAKQRLAGNARLEFRQLEILQLLVPEITDPRGSLELGLGLTGSLAQPRLAGRARIVDGEVRIPRLGLQITAIRLDGSTDDADNFNFVLSANSGEGTLRIEGRSRLDAAAGWPTRLDISGEDFEASHIPEAAVRLSPQLVVELQHRDILVSGDLHIPYARLEPRDITTAARVSNDTVIVGQERPEDTGWRISTRVNLTLGERVTFFGYGFEGSLAGRLLIEEQPGQPTTGSGEITIPQGRYRAYGQRLDIENGRVLFTGGPLVNPGLDIRATRTSGDVISGLQIGGRLQQPTIELFSIPAMGQTDILSYLLFGRPVETASGEDSAMMAQAALALGIAGGDRIARSMRERFGLDDFRVETDDSGDQASLVIGRYLSPDVYVSYGVGLLEAVNSLSLRYQITDRWQLEAVSGTYHGADLLYSIER